MDRVNELVSKHGISELHAGCILSNGCEPHPFVKNAIKRRSAKVLMIAIKMHKSFLNKIVFYI